MSVIVTGSSGFIGTAVCRALADAGKNVIGLSRFGQGLEHPRVRTLKWDILHPQGLAEIARNENCEAIFHFAAALPQTTTNSVAAVVEANVLATAHMLDVFDQTDAKVFVYASSLPLIGRPSIVPIREDHPVVPETIYHASKYAGELCVLEYGRSAQRRVIAFRISSPYGQGMRPTTVLPLFLSRAMRGETIELHGSGKRVQNFIHISDIAGACLAVFDGGSGCYNLAGTKNISMKDLAAIAVELADNNKGGVRLSGKVDSQEEYRWEVDISKMARELRYVPKTSLREGCAVLYETMRTNGNGQHDYEHD